MHYLIVTTLLLVLMIGIGSPGHLETRDSFETEPLAQAPRQIRWPRKTVEVALSTSLLSSGAQIKGGSDVVGAARRALARWSSMANITFVVTWSSKLSVSPASGGDGVSLITVADTYENESFNADSTTGRTRVFFDPETGIIAEADISINPQPRSEEGANMQFSTDGTAGTYDLEATFTHEIGHLLGLDHSGVLASTMQARQAFNGMFGLPAFTERTLSEDDRQRVLDLYGPRLRLGRIEGRITDASATSPLSTRLTIFAESVATGRIIASDVTASDGTYRLNNLAPGEYRVFAEPQSEDASVSRASLGQDVSEPNIAKKFAGFELSSQVVVKNDEVSMLNYDIGSNLTTVPNLNPRWIGLNGELSTVALPLHPGKRIKIYVGGQGIDQVPGTSISVNSPYFSVDAASLSREQIGTPFAVISFEVTVAANAPFGDYSIRLQSNSGELANLPGAITVDPGTSLTAANPLDDSRFFISQQYADILGHEADRATIESFVTQLLQCGSKADCLRGRKVDIAAAVLTQNGLLEGVGLLNGLYTTALNRRPRFSDFENARNLLVRTSNDFENASLAVALSFVQLGEFERRYPSSMNATEFIDSLLLSVLQRTGIDLSTERPRLLELFDGTNLGRAVILNTLVNNARFVEAQRNEAFVLAEYFAFLRRDPDESGFGVWVNSVRPRTVRDPAAARSLVCQFLNSDEYQRRFAMVVTHTSAECN